MTELIIRAAQPADQAAIHAVTLAAYQEYAALIPPPFWEGYKENIEHTLADVGAAVQLVAEQDGALVGAVLLVASDAFPRVSSEDAVASPAPEIRLLAVAPAGRGKGIGKALVHECLRRARQAGAASVILHTGDVMAVAQAMYVRLGFQRAPELDFQPTPDVIVKGYRLSLA